jgi:chromate transporter
MTLTLIDWFSLFINFFAASLLAVGGAISAAPEMHRFLVDEHHWLDDATFASSITVAQAAPGPNVLFVAVMGMNVGLGASGGVQAGWQAWAYGLLTAYTALIGMLIPSGILTLFITQLAHKHKDLSIVRSFKAGLAPIVVGLLLSAGYVLNIHNNNPQTDWPLWVLTLVSAVLVWRTQIHLLILIGSGALLGGLGWLQA